MAGAHDNELLHADGVSSAEIRSALNASVGLRLRKILPALIFCYLVLAILCFVFGPEEGVEVLGWLAYAIGASSLICWMLLRRDRIPSNRVHLLACLIGGMIAAHCVVKVHLTSDTSQVTVIMLLLLGSAATLLSLRSFVFIASLAMLGWILIAADTLSFSKLVSLTGGLVLTALVSGLGAWLRLRKHYEQQERRLSEQNKRLQEKLWRERFDLAVEGSRDGLWYWDLKKDTLHLSPSCESLLGYTKGELATDPEEWFSRVHPAYLAELRRDLSAHIYGGSNQFRNEHRLRRRDGTYIWVLARGAAIRDDSGEAIGLAGSHTDISSLIEVEKRLLNDAFHDKLTDLPNRHFFMGRLETALEKRNRYGGGAGHFGVLFLDLDRFKVVNDSLGHLVGDQLLAAVGSRLKSCARPGDVVARFGGDEFVVLVEEIRHPEEVLAVGRRIQKVLSEPFQIGEREVTSGASVGIALSSEKIDQAEDILRFADIAMYYAKTQRKGQVQMFTADMQSQVAKLCELQNDLGRALHRGELLLHYQPCISVQSGRITGVEALIRWQRPGEDLLYPGDFIPMAEEMGLIGDIGEWALRSACEQNSSWQRAGLSPIRMGVNLSARQLQQRDFPQSVIRILKETNLESNWLELELTETALMDSLDVAPATLDQLSAKGIRTSIDDFGTGYSSLNYLRRFNFQTLKMDRCFVSDITTDDKAAAVASGLISLAHNLGLTVVAEGVESNDQLQFLAAERCDQIQGYLTGRPIPPESLTKLLRSTDLTRKLSASVAAGGLVPDLVLSEPTVGRASGAGRRWGAA